MLLHYLLPNQWLFWLIKVTQLQLSDSVTLQFPSLLSSGSALNLLGLTQLMTEAHCFAETLTSQSHSAPICGTKINDSLCNICLINYRHRSRGIQIPKRLNQAQIRENVMLNCIREKQRLSF